ncbi:Hypothetical protein R9X50_00724700 [Acrodontium crateriforme]|uniref:Large ribosomal subunit protein mL49 n=1 Tax=Acrodontium crateriforme TaxID=150365 RepID=A0AAQ3MB71_9PEZI|nr:Hypothetical protein R9X50_00724700 [Acrodontium crateriforme]
MAATAPMMPFLRPLRLPRPSTVRSFLNHQFSTTARHAQTQSSQASADPNFIASQTASPVYPPPSFKSLARPKESRSSRRTAYPRKERAYPTRQPSHSPTTYTPLTRAPITPLSDELCAPNLPYFVSRTPSNELPIYLLRQRGGSLHLTRVKKIDGSIEAFRDALREELGLGEKEATINPITKHVILKGHWKPQVEQFLRKRKF